MASRHQSRKRKREPSPTKVDSDSSSEISESDIQLGSTQFVPAPDDSEQLWDAIAILGERGNQFLVDWDGIDPTTGEKWDPSWTDKTSVTNDLILEWKKKKEKEKSRQNKTKKRTPVPRSRSSASTAPTSAAKGKQRAPNPKPQLPTRGRASSRSRPSTQTTSSSSTGAKPPRIRNSDDFSGSEKCDLATRPKKLFTILETASTSRSISKDSLADPEQGPSTPRVRRAVQPQRGEFKDETKTPQLPSRRPRLEMVVELPLLRRTTKHHAALLPVEDGTPARKRLKLSDTRAAADSRNTRMQPPATAKRHTATHSQTDRKAAFDSASADSQDAEQPNSDNFRMDVDGQLPVTRELSPPGATPSRPRALDFSYSHDDRDTTSKKSSSKPGQEPIQVPVVAQDASMSSLTDESVEEDDEQEEAEPTQVKPLYGTKPRRVHLPATQPGDSDSEDETQLKLADVAGKIKLKTYDRGGGRVRPALQRQVSSSSSIKLPPGLPPTAPDSEEDSDSEASSAVAAINEKGKVKKSWPMFSRRNKTRGKDVYDSSSTSQNATSSKSSGSVNLRTSVHEQKHALLNRSPSPAVPSTMNPATINGKIPSNDSGCPGSDEPGSVELNARHVSFRAPTASIYGSGEDDAAQVHDFDPATEENASEQTTESKLASLTRRYPKGSRTKSESPLKTPLPLLDQESSPYRSPDQSIKAVDFAMQPVKQIIPPLASEEEDSDDDFDRAFVRTAVRRATPAPGIHSPTPSDDERPTSSDLRAGLHEDDEQIQLPDIDLVMGDSEPASLPTPQSMADDDDDDAEDRQEISTTQSITEPQEYQTGRNVDSTAPSKSLRPVRDISPSTFTPFLAAHGQSSQIEPITEFTPSPERFKHRSVQPAQSTSDSLSSTQSKPSESEELSQVQEQSQISSQSPSTSGPSQSQAGLSSQADSLPQSMDLSRRGEELAEQYYRQRMTAEVTQKRNWFTSFTSLLTTTAKEPQSPSSQEPAVTSHTSQVDVTDSLPGPSVDVGATPALEVDMEGVDQFINWEMAEPSTAIQQPGLRGQPEDPPKVPSRDALFEVDEVRERHSAEVAALQARLLKAEAELHSTRDAMAAVVAERDAARRNLEAFTSQGHAASTSNLFASGSSGISAAALSSVDGTAELQSQLNEAQTRIAELEVTLQERERDISSLKTQIELLQSVSRKANDAAARFGREARELEEKNKILDSQVKFGVAQAHSVGEERAKHLQRDLAEAKLTIELLQQQSRLTDDTVRARAAEHPKLLQRIEDIKDQLNGRMRQIDDIGLRNRQLQDQLDEERVKSSQEQRIVFRCPWHTGRRCGEYFSTHQDLDEHVATAHVPDENAAYLASLGHLGDLDPMDISY